MRRRSLLAASTAGAAALLGGCTDAVTGPESAPPPDSSKWKTRQGVQGELSDSSAQNLVVERHAYATADGSAKVSGVVRNTGDSRIDGVEVAVALVRDGSEFRNGSATSDGAVAPDETWQFAVTFGDIDGKVERYVVETSAV